MVERAATTSLRWARGLSELIPATVARHGTQVCARTAVLSAAAPRLVGTRPGAQHLCMRTRFVLHIVRGVRDARLRLSTSGPGPGPGGETEPETDAARARRYAETWGGTLLGPGKLAPGNPASDDLPYDTNAINKRCAVDSDRVADLVGRGGHGIDAADRSAPHDADATLMTVTAGPKGRRRAAAAVTAAAAEPRLVPPTPRLLRTGGWCS